MHFTLPDVVDKTPIPNHRHLPKRIAELKHFPLQVFLATALPSEKRHEFISEAYY